MNNASAFTKLRISEEINDFDVVQYYSTRNDDNDMNIHVNDFNLKMEDYTKLNLDLSDEPFSDPEHGCKFDYSFNFYSNFAPIRKQ